MPKAIDLMAWSLRWRGIEAEVFRMHWQTSKSYEKKEKELAKLIEKRSRDYRVSLIGISAGAVPALNLMSKSSLIHKVITACGWSRPVDEGNKKYYDELAEVSVAFGEGVKELTANFEEIKKLVNKIWAFRTRDDEFVSYQTAMVEGSKVTDVNVRGHVRAISFSLIGYRREIVDFIKEEV